MLRKMFIVSLILAPALAVAAAPGGRRVDSFKKADADTVLLFVTPVHAVRIMGTAKSMQFDPLWTSTTRISSTMLVTFDCSNSKTIGSIFPVIFFHP